MDRPHAGRHRAQAVPSKAGPRDIGYGPPAHPIRRYPGDCAAGGAAAAGAAGQVRRHAPGPGNAVERGADQPLEPPRAGLEQALPAPPGAAHARRSGRRLGRLGREPRQDGEQGGAGPLVEGLAVLPGRVAEGPPPVGAEPLMRKRPARGDLRLVRKAGRAARPDFFVRNVPGKAGPPGLAGRLGQADPGAPGQGALDHFRQPRRDVARGTLRVLGRPPCPIAAGPV